MIIPEFIHVSANGVTLFYRIINSIVCVCVCVCVCIVYTTSIAFSLHNIKDPVRKWIWKGIDCTGSLKKNVKARKKMRKQPREYHKQDIGSTYYPQAGESKGVNSLTRAQKHPGRHFLPVLCQMILWRGGCPTPGCRPASSVRSAAA